MKIVSSAIAMLIATGTSSVFAANLPCKYCSESGYTNRAINAGLGQHYVYDYAHDNLRHFEVLCGVIPRSTAGGDDKNPTASRLACGPSMRLSAELIPNEPRVTELFDTLKAYWDSNGGSMAKWYEITYSDLTASAERPDADAYDVLEDVNFRARLGAFVMAPSSNLFRFLTGFGEAFNGLTEGITVRFRITFADGTQVEYEAIYPNIRAEYIRETAFTDDGQIIPEANAQSNTGLWNTSGWSQSELQDFIDHLRYLGVPVTGGSDEIRCTWDGHELRC